MFIFFIFLLSFSLSTHCMEAPHGKRGQQDSNMPNKSSRLSYYGIPTLEGIPDEVKVMILEYVIFANAVPAQTTTAQQDAKKVVAGPDETLEDVYFNHALKKSHPCFFINKKFAQLSHRARLALLPRLEGRCPSQFIEATNIAASSSARCSFLERMIQASRMTIFNLTKRLTPLMIAVGYDNENGVQLLLSEAKKRNILQQYVNLDCDREHNNSAQAGMVEILKYDFECPSFSTALHVACHTDNKTSAIILKDLLRAGAHPHVFDINESTPLARAIVLTDGNHLQSLVRVSLLLKAGADPKIGPESEEDLEFEGTPEEEVELAIGDDCLDESNKPTYRIIKQLFEKHSKRN